MSRVVCRHGVARGAESHSFSADDLLRALKEYDSETLYAEAEGGGRLRGGARLAVRARLAPSALSAALLLSARGAALAVRAAAAAPPRAELLLWFADDALCALDMPFLTPRHVARAAYVCPACAAPFPDPNPLKVHLFLACAPFTPDRFWRAVAERLQAPRGPAPPCATPSAAQLEALATEWGRGAAGHACVYCGKLYSRRYGLKIHLRTHTGYRPLRCRHCQRAFGDPSNLNKHERLHGRAPGGPGRAPGPPARHTCAACGRALARRRDLERHVRTHAPAHALTHTLPQATEQ